MTAPKLHHLARTNAVCAYCRIPANLAPEECRYNSAGRGAHRFDEVEMFDDVAAIASILPRPVAEAGRLMANFWHGVDFMNVRLASEYRDPEDGLEVIVFDGPVADSWMPNVSRRSNVAYKIHLDGSVPLDVLAAVFAAALTDSAVGSLARSVLR